MASASLLGARPAASSASRLLRALTTSSSPPPPTRAEEAAESAERRRTLPLPRSRPPRHRTYAAAAAAAAAAPAPAPVRLASIASSSYSAALSTAPSPTGGGRGGIESRAGSGAVAGAGAAVAAGGGTVGNHIDDALAAERYGEEGRYGRSGGDDDDHGRGGRGGGGGGGGGGGKAEIAGRRKISGVPISEVLKAKHTLRWVEPVISKDASVSEAIQVCIERGLSGMMVVDRSETTTDASRERGRVVGMTTSRDLLRVMSAGFKDGKDADELMEVRVSEFMTPISQVIYARPEETIGMCRTVMAKLGVKCLPILSNGRVEGLITARDMSEFGLEAKERGGKTNYLRHVSERVGLGANTSMAEPPAYLRAHLALEQHPLFVNIGVAELPHPFKTPDGCGMDARDHGPRDYSTDPDLSEDAHFVMNTEIPDETGKGVSRVTYMGVADGVGSWREYGVDPREFSHRLMEECESVLREAAAKSRNFVGDERYRRPVAPAEVLARAYDRVRAGGVIGSSTACVGLFDNVRHQLHFSNLGDSGIVVLRHIDSDVAGALKRDRTTPRAERTSDLRVAFVSQQQLRSFNHPYQLGWTGEELDESDGSSFKTAADSCTTSVHVRRGDIVIMATDGLFDNVDIDDITRMALDWEQDNGFIRGGDLAARDRRWSMGSSMSALSAEAVPGLAEALCARARENSLDDALDSPFAVLAKENDIMWSGGMPDDCTVVAMHVVGRSPDDPLGMVGSESL